MIVNNFVLVVVIISILVILDYHRHGESCCTNLPVTLQPREACGDGVCGANSSSIDLPKEQGVL